MGSSLMSMFSRMSLSAPLAQYSVISVMLCSSADISTHAPMKLYTVKYFLWRENIFQVRYYLLTLSWRSSRISFISFITSRLISFFRSNWSSFILTILLLYFAVWQKAPRPRDSPKLKCSVENFLSIRNLVMLVRSDAVWRKKNTGKVQLLYNLYTSLLAALSSGQDLRQWVHLSNIMVFIMTIHLPEDEKCSCLYPYLQTI